MQCGMSRLSRASTSRPLEGGQDLSITEPLMSYDEQADAESGSAGLLLRQRLLHKESFFGSFSQIEDAVHLHLQEDSYSSVTRVIRYVYTIAASAAMIVAVRLWGEMTPGEQ